MRSLAGLIALLVSLPVAAQEAPDEGSAAASASTAGDRGGFILLGHLGFNGEGEFDKVEFEGDKVGGSDKEDFEKNFGVAAIFEVPRKGKLHLGARGALTMAEGDDSDQKSMTIDGGVWGRYLLTRSGDMEIFGAGAAGLTYADSETEDGDNLTGIGGHIVLGAGIAKPSGSMDLFAALFYSYQLVPELSGDVETQGASGELALIDAEVSRFLLSAGVKF